LNAEALKRPTIGKHSRDNFPQTVWENPAIKLYHCTSWLVDLSNQLRDKMLNVWGEISDDQTRRLGARFARGC